MVRLLLIMAVAPLFRSADRDLPAILRVRLLEQLAPRTLTVEAPHGGLGVYVAPSERPSFSAAAGSRLRITITGAEARIEGEAGAVQAREIRLASPAGEAMTLHSGSNVRSYMGDVHASVDRGVLRLINHVPLEDYVASVVSAEYGLDDIEGSKAMAVIARTYALKALKSDAYEQVDHTLSQVYRGTRAVTPLALAAARATQGEVLTHDGDLIEAVYSSSSGGHTANNEDVWQAQPHSYLRGRNDPWDAISPHHEWTYEIAGERLHGLLREAFGLDVRSIEVAERSDDGRARTLSLRAAGGRDRSLSAQEFRLAVIRKFGPTALRSTFFDLRRTGDRYVFAGRGFGHGVGLSQWGAHAMALDGRSYREILAYYYRDVRLEPGEARDPLMPLALVRAGEERREAADSTSSVARPGWAGEERREAADSTSSVARPGWAGDSRPQESPGRASSTTRVIRRRLGW